jgi:hypothetical protein
VAPVAENRRPTAQLEDLLEPVAHEENRDAAVARLADDREQPLHLVRGERGGWLIEDEHARIDGERLGDLDQLLVGHRETADDRRPESMWTLRLSKILIRLERRMSRQLTECQAGRWGYGP